MRGFLLSKTQPMDVKKCFLKYQWPGNLRELQNIVRGLIVNSEKSEITIEMLPKKMRQNTCSETIKTTSGLTFLQIPLRQIEKNAIEGAINLCNGDVAKATQMLDAPPQRSIIKFKRGKI